MRGEMMFFVADFIRTSIHICVKAVWMIWKGIGKLFKGVTSLEKAIVILFLLNMFLKKEKQK